MAIFTSAALGAGLISLGSGFLATVSAIALNAAVGIGLQLAVRALNGKQKGAEPLGVRGKLQAGGDVARSIVIGNRATAGSLVYANTWGAAGKTPNAYFTQVIALSDMLVRALKAMWVNGQAVTVDTSSPVLPASAGYPVTEYRVNGVDYLWVRFYDGNQTEADPFLVNSVSSGSRPYESTRVGRGIAYAVVTARSNPELFSGFPSYRFELQGMPLYDPSRDSSVGGAGLQRWDNPATWGGDGDDYPVVQVYNILRGIRHGGEWVYGLQTMTGARLPVADWIAQIAKCRKPVDGPSGPEAQYMTGAEISLDTEIATTIERLLIGCHGNAIETGGIYKVRVGEPDAPVFAFSDADILSTEPQTANPVLGLSATINGITASYPEPAEAWNTKAAPALYSAPDEARAGGRRLVSDLDLSAVSRARQVQQIMQSALREAQRERRHTMTLGPEYWEAEPGDYCVFSSVRNGYVTKLFRIDGVADKSNLDITLDMTEVDPADYHYDYFADYTPPVFAPIAPGAPPAQIMQGWAALPDTVQDANGVGRRPAIRVYCAAGLDDVARVAINVYLKATGALVFASEATAYAAPHNWPLSGAWCLPDTEYEVEGKLVPYTSRKTLWSDRITVRTYDLRLTDADLDNAIRDNLADLQDWINADLPGQIGQAGQDISELAGKIATEIAERLSGAILQSQRYRGLTADMEQLRDAVMEVDLGAFDAKEQLRRTLTARIGETEASFEERITVAVSATSALAQRATSLEASASSLSSRITLEELSRISQGEALAQQLALLSVGTDNQFDPAKLWAFDAGAEGWSGNGAPTVAGGWLRPANSTAAYVTSPAGLAISTNTYRQVRARVQKTGAPVWAGYVWWAAASDADWATARRVEITEPIWDANGIGLVTVNMAWSGTIDRIRLDLSAVQSATDAYAYDWIAIGSPSPGASRAELVAERQARISGDAANAEQITALSAALTSTNGTVSGLASGVSALQATVTQQGNDLVSTGNALTALSVVVEGKAGIDVVDALSAEVSALGGGGITALGQIVSGIRSTLIGLEDEVMDLAARQFSGQMEAKDVVAVATNTLDTKITLTADNLDILSRAVTLVQATLGDKADAQAVSALTSRVTATESGLTSTGNAITSINATLGGKANAADVNNALAQKASLTAVNTLTGRVDAAENSLSSQGSAITSINAALGGKANAADVNNALAAKADASAVAGLSATVSNQGGAISALSESLTAVSVKTDKGTASGRLRATAASTPSGVTARVGLSVAASDSDNAASAAMFLQATSGGVGEILINASRLRMVDSNLNGQVVFAVEDGVTRLNIANIGTVNAGVLNSLNGKMTINLNLGTITIRS